MGKEHIQADLGASAFLAALGYELAGLREIAPRRSAFVFRDPTRTAERDVARYFAGATIGAERIVHAIRDLKSELRVAKNFDQKKESREDEDRPQFHRTIPSR